MKTLAQVKTIAKKRHELLLKRLEVPPHPSSKIMKLVRKKEFKGVKVPPCDYPPKEFKGPKISDIYETMAIEAGFKDWNGYSSHLQNPPPPWGSRRTNLIDYLNNKNIPYEIKEDCVVVKVEKELDACYVDFPDNVIIDGNLVIYGGKLPAKRLEVTGDFHCGGYDNRDDKLPENLKVGGILQLMDHDVVHDKVDTGVIDISQNYDIDLIEGRHKKICASILMDGETFRTKVKRQDGNWVYDETSKRAYET